MKEITIIIAGPRGNMGMEAVKLTEQTEHFKLLAVVDTKNEGKRLSELDGMPNLDIPIYTDIEKCFTEQQPDVLIDLTSPESGRVHLEAAIDHGVRPVIGTTGFSQEDIERLRAKAEDKEIGAIIAPNFAIGAILMMKFAQTAARYMPDVEILEMHHDKKLDAPSGTAHKTAQLIAEVREAKKQGHPQETEDLPGARGAELDGMRIHSIRLPGLVAHQEVLFGGPGQTLTIRHDSINRASFMPGVRLSVEAVLTLNTLVYGLEHIIE
ncbi:4-hydroxy-tetrahydrodipicolinate reductase [Alkalicoccobacillus plakortidis]|uniref:4-hydroxy-tetrahydrodipicolinate reductase n=1 Tax=Alkalicoccobacillus plakortidis TaxID=444060 RepID=A0ABT0XGK1_9BACI|nr:4-hydroxy-tetrahydrodipicolinate reductase [Alkalicoccobacillus plakortidis]MCM2674354.1 4-hydroxy-tetrahydrodipicolinate reductase [Alkalicoccobacillus plakortidis]